MKSFDRLCEVINKTADITNRKNGEAERHFFQTPIREAKNLRRSSRTVRHKGLLSFYHFGQAGIRLVLDFQSQHAVPAIRENTYFGSLD